MDRQSGYGSVSNQSRKCGKSKKPSTGEYLFMFLVNSGFASILPFFPIILFEDGFTYIEIGCILGFGQFISFFGALFWSRVCEKRIWRKLLKMVSLFTWIIVLSPFVLLDMRNITANESCKEIGLNSTANERNKHNMTLIVTNTFVYSHLIGLKIPHDRFVVGFIIIYALGSLLTCIMDNFNFDYYRITSITSQPLWLSGDSNNTLELYIATNLPSGTSAVLVAIALLHIGSCDPNFGNYKLNYLIFAMIIVLSIMTLQFTEDESEITNHVNQTNVNLHRKSASSVYVTMLIPAVVDALMSAFLYLHMHVSGASYLCIAVAFMSKKASETILFTAKDFFNRHLSTADTIFIYSSINAARCLLASASVGINMWLLIATEFAAGFCLIVHVTLNDIKHIAERERTNSVHPQINALTIMYWAFGKLIGCIAGGMCIDEFGAPVTLSVASMLSIFSAMVAAIIKSSTSSLKN